jgi:hypothetical protein
LTKSFKQTPHLPRLFPSFALSFNHFSLLTNKSEFDAFRPEKRSKKQSVKKAKINKSVTDKNVLGQKRKIRIYRKIKENFAFLIL